jgi:mono/diheme cytochrome c family protein
VAPPAEAQAIGDLCGLPCLEVDFSRGMQRLMRRYQNRSRLFFKNLTGSMLAIGFLMTGWCLQGALSPAMGKDLSPAASQAVRSLLSNRCFACHGPDEEKVEAGLRLDQRDAALGLLPSGERAIVAGDPDASQLIDRITSTDPDIRMPPPAFGDALREDEVELLRGWIAAGAPQVTHWSFIAPGKHPLPEVAPSGLACHDPIDRWVEAARASHRISGSPQADPATLLRRLSLDLTGLPPTSEELEVFLADSDPNALVKQIDRLLASPAYGEHQARRWLDLARYADSAGYADDPPRTIWAYRDWVVQAFNEAMPFDHFTRLQLAGDLLPKATTRDLVATAFHRNTLTNNEGGTNDEEFRNVAVVDRVNTTMAVWMGLTMACSQCHSHKYDPISQREYFQVFDLFNQTEDADRGDESPRIDLLTAQQELDQKRWQQEADRLREELQQPIDELKQERLEWMSHIARPPQWNSFSEGKLWLESAPSQRRQFQSSSVRVDPKEVKDTVVLELPVPSTVKPDQLRGIRVQTIPQADLPGGGAGAAGGNFVLSRVEASWVAADRSIQSRPAVRYVRIELPGKQRILSLAEVELFSEGRNIAVGGKASQSSTDFAGPPEKAIDGNSDGRYDVGSTTHSAISDNPWWELELPEAVPIDAVVLHNRTDGNIFDRLDGAQVQLLDEERQVVWSRSQPKATREPMKLVVEKERAIGFNRASADFSQDGFGPQGVLDSNPDSGWAVGGAIASPHQIDLFFPAVDLGEDAEALRTIRLRLEFQSKHTQHILASFEVAWTDAPHGATRSEISREMLASLEKDPSERSQEEELAWAQLYQRRFAPSLAPQRNRLDQLEASLAALKPATSVPVLRDRPAGQRRETFVHVRGNYRSKGETVTAGLPASFPPLRNAEGVTRAPGNRLDLVDWLMQPENPLTARVHANRLWESLFGLGLVRTSEDFGSQGDPPSHPELLDYLALETQRLSWDNKMLLHRIVRSATYQQASPASSAQLEADPDNVWLGRGPRYRLTAEQLRDQALAIAGLLAKQMYGEPVKPPQPKMGLSAAFGGGTDWETSPGSGRYRRGLYTTWRRSNPYPSMATFDAPNREVCTLKRDRTNTPLQALVTLNDPVFVEAAQGLARRMLLEAPVDAAVEKRIAYGFLLATSRPPSDREAMVLHSLWLEARGALLQEKEDAIRLATDPIGPLPDGLDAVDVAAMTAVANVILNLDEVLMTR